MLLNFAVLLSVFSDGLNIMQDCFNKASKLILERNGVWLAGLHQVELGNFLCKLGRPTLALKYLSRGMSSTLGMNLFFIFRKKWFQ